MRFLLRHDSIQIEFIQSVCFWYQARGLLTQYKGHEELGHKMLHFPEKDLLLTAIRASTDATLKIVILVLLGVYATTKGTQSQNRLPLEESSPNGE
jgi:hypothetical protein